MRRCPFCAEDVADDATRCPYCASDLTAATATGPGGGSSPAAGAGASTSSAGAPLPSAGAPPSADDLPSAGAGDPWSAGGAGPGADAAPVAATVRFSHTGQRFLLGYDDADFGIWDRTAPAAPVERFPRSDEGWSQAWRRYSSLEPGNQPVQAVTTGSYVGPAADGGVGAPYGGAGAAYVSPAAQPAGWAHQGYGAPARRTNSMATASLVLGICGMVLFWLFAVPPILALIFGNVARGQIRTSGGTQEGDGMAIAGIVLGIVGIVLFVVALIIGATRNPS